MLTVKAIRCPICKDIIYSRAVHDFHSCSCGSVTIDGGFDYCHVSWAYGLKMPEGFDLKIPATKPQLYEDWNFMTNKFGVIKIRKSGKLLYFKSLRKLGK